MPPPMHASWQQRFSRPSTSPHSTAPPWMVMRCAVPRATVPVTTIRLRLRCWESRCRDSRFLGNVLPGSAVRIMTGAPLPTGADAVIPAEFTSEADGRVEVTATVSPEKHVGRTGEDVAAGSRLFSAGRRLRPQDVGLLASVGVKSVEVVRPTPRPGTGDRRGAGHSRKTARDLSDLRIQLRHVTQPDRT